MKHWTQQYASGISVYLFVLSYLRKIVPKVDMPQEVFVDFV